MTSEKLLLDDAEQIRKAIASSIQRWGAGRLAEALVSIEAQGDIYTLADYMVPGEGVKVGAAKDAIEWEEYQLEGIGMVRRRKSH